jgi:hypothetical protein
MSVSSAARRVTKSKRIPKQMQAFGTSIYTLTVLVKEYIGSRKNGFLFETSGGLPMSPRNIMRDGLHPIRKSLRRLGWKSDPALFLLA